MKKFFYLIPLVGMLMASCASDEPATSGGNKGEAHNSYLTINIQQTSGYGTKADNTQGDGTYRDGTQSERQVNSIRFFFFDEDGDGAPVSVVTQEGQPDSYLSYIDWTHYDSTLGGGIPGETVEATLSATLGLFIKSGESEPKSMIAVINPSTAVKNLTGAAGSYGPTMKQVQNAVADFESGLTDGNFVMSNSVYAAGDPIASVNYTSLVPAEGEPSYFQSSIEAAQANPVTIWVERVVARLDLSIAISNSKPMEVGGEFLYPVMKKVVSGNQGSPQDDIQATVDGKKVYVKFLGWNVTSTPNQSYLVKMINPNWGTETLFGATSPIWNTQDYHRCFWAMNPELGANGYQYGSFLSDTKDPKNLQPAWALDIPATDEYTTTYMLENASPYSSTLTAAAPTSPTKVIIAAQLVYENNEPIQLAEWGYQKYTQSDLLIYLATNVISQGNFYKKTDTGYSSLTADDLCFVSAQTKYPNGLPANVKDYYSFVELTAAPEGSPATEWFIKDGDSYKSTTADSINEYITNSVGYTMSWYNGYTYYYFDVRHLGQPNSVGYNGIVRNHLYEAVVTSLYGYGTPVPNPDEIIIPQTPEYEEILLAAQIRILEWRVVHSSYDLDWR